MSIFTQIRTQPPLQLSALILRIGLGLLFLIGGTSKLGQLLDPAREAAIVEAYTGTAGYINQFFIDYLFSSGLLTPWFFLTTLSTFEFLSGVALILGLFVRPLSLIYAFLLWTFVIALPVITTPGVEVSVKTFTSPALLVQIRDVALSGMMFVLYMLGPGPFSVDRSMFRSSTMHPINSWDNSGLLLRLSIGMLFLVAGLFAGLDHIPTFATNHWILLATALLLISGTGVRYVGYLVMAIMIWYMIYKLNIDKTLIANLNSFKREVAFLGAGAVLILMGGGEHFKLKSLLNKNVSKQTVQRAIPPAKADP